MQTYRYGKSTSQEGDLFLPSVSNPPVVCLLHGGFWRMPYGRDQLTEIGKDLAAKKFAVWNIGYRRIGETERGWEETLEDVGTAIDHLAVLVAEGMKLDLDRVIVAGHSAGGQLALWAAKRSKHSTHVRLRAVIGLAAITDLARTWQLNAGKGAVNEFLGGSPMQFPDRYKETSPIEMLPLGVRQLILHGTKDEALPIDLAREYVAAAKVSGDNIEFVELPDAGHMDFIDPNSKAYEVFYQWIAEHI